MSQHLGVESTANVSAVEAHVERPQHSQRICRSDAGCNRPPRELPRGAQEVIARLDRQSPIALRLQHALHLERIDVAP
jgi:hypothetical protein